MAWYSHATFTRSLRLNHHYTISFWIFFTDGWAIYFPEGEGIFYWLLTSDFSFSEEQAVEFVAVLSLIRALLSQGIGGLGRSIIQRRLMAGFDQRAEKVGITVFACGWR